MKPILTFDTETFTVSDLGREATVPDLIAGTNIQNKTHFYLEEDDEIFEGYGKLYTSYPYRQYTCYTRALQEEAHKTATLENDYLKAVFLPELGGRLWSLIDKTTGENLLYTNDVIRPSNLAIRNAWVSGGVEWNISMIGHTPFTMEQLFTARLELPDGTPVLRMYEYERVRKVTYQMDFWLGEEDRFLNCRMRIFNQTDQVIPMYWWSNMAVPEYESGRVIVPASEAYTNRADGVYKVDIPMVDGVDVTQYKQIPNQIDYFFNIPKESPKYIANINSDGYGLLHLSTSRLQSRKLFSWGRNEGSDNWQDFLTEKAGRYVEIQGGLGKTQYGCIPMAPHTAWEWLELYGPVHVSSDLSTCAYEDALRKMNLVVDAQLQELQPELKLTETKDLAKRKGELLCEGHPYGAFENELRTLQGEKPLSPNLDFGKLNASYKEWVDFLNTGLFPQPKVSDVPFDFVADEALFEKLKETIASENASNWYANYQLGLCYFVRNNFQKALRHLEFSNKLSENPWALHALAALHLKKGEKDAASDYIAKGFAMRKDDLSYVKEVWKVLLLCEKYELLLELHGQLSSAFRKESRIHLGYLTAKSKCGAACEILAYLNETHLVLDDLRECEDSLGDLWLELNEKIVGDGAKVPKKYNYHSL